eukprot:scaffold54209_cov57-Phaeocystis_antarctica.AAC.2
MSSLFASDKELVSCRAEARASEVGSCAGAGPIRGGGQGTSGERTSNMSLKSVTLDVSKLSGWLNDAASCRESKGGHIRCGVRFWPRKAGGGGRRSASSVQGEERTLNMLNMLVTLEVSNKRSGWLNTLAPCRESKGGHAVCGARFWPEGGTRRARRATAAHAACRGGRYDWGQGTGRNAR